MGDSKNTVEILHVNFKPEDAAYNGIATIWIQQSSRMGK